MKKFISFTFLFFAVFSIYSQTRIYPAYGKIYTNNDEEINRKQYREVTFKEVRKICDEAKQKRNVDSLINLKFKTKCHLVSVYKFPQTNWKYLTLYCDGQSLDNFLSPNSNVVPDEPLFDSVEIYYHYKVFADGTIERKDDGIEWLLEGRFVNHCYVAVENLKVRENPSLDSEKIGLINQNQYVTVLEVGKKEKIDRIESVWVKVKTADGKEGWSFGGYLTDGILYYEKYPWEK